VSLRYDLKAVNLMVGGFRINGAGENGLVEFEWERDIAEVTVGADGDAIVSALNSNALFADITLLESALGYTTLAAQMEIQRIASGLGGPQPAIPFFLFDTINGDSVSGGCRFLTRPGPSKGRTVGERVFRVVLPKAVVLYGTLNVAPF
jgi:hypothetical protein